jgi:site-specific recombinase XerD
MQVQHGSNAGFLLGWPRHRPCDPNPITRRSVARVFESVGQVVTPKVRLSTHSMRKTCCYTMYAAGVSLEQICKVLNHSHPKVTMRYIGLDDAAIQQS